jgi:hypothetical protein
VVRIETRVLKNEDRLSILKPRPSSIICLTFNVKKKSDVIEKRKRINKKVIFGGLDILRGEECRTGIFRF